jgi:ribosomal protein S18 acetylase RimI-like enzyme
MSQTPPPVRRALLSDARAIARVHVESWRVAYAGLMPSAVIDAFTLEKREALWKAILARRAPEERTFVVASFDDGGVAGFVSTGPSRDEDEVPGVAEVYALYLSPAHFGLGLGRALFAAAIEDLRGRPYAEVTLGVLDGNARGRRFYEAAGMRPDGAPKVEIDHGAELAHVRYRLALADG